MLCSMVARPYAIYFKKIIYCHCFSSVFYFGWEHSSSMLEMAFATPRLVLICVVFYLCHQKKWLVASVIFVAYFVAWGCTVKFGEPIIERRLETWLDENYSINMRIFDINSPCPFIVKGEYTGGGSAFTFHGTVYYFHALNYTYELHREESPS